MTSETIFSCSLHTGYCNLSSENQVDLTFNWHFLKAENGILIFINKELNHHSFDDFPKDHLWIKVVNNSNEKRRINLDIHNLYTDNTNKTEEVGFLEIVIPSPIENNSKNAIVRLMRQVKSNLGKIYQTSFVDGVKVLSA